MITQIHGDHVVVFTAEPEEDARLEDWCECPKELKSMRGKLERGTLIHFCAKAAIYDESGKEGAIRCIRNTYPSSVTMPYSHRRT